MAISLIVVFGLLACGGDKPAGGTPAEAAAAATAVTQTVQVAADPPTAVPTAAVRQEPALAASPTESAGAQASPTSAQAAVTPPSATPTPAPAPSATQASVPDPRPTAVANGAVPNADIAFQTDGDETLSTVEVVKILRPSVVHVATSLDAGMGTLNQPVQEGVGTGVILDGDGHILTNFHVVEGAQRIIVTLDSKLSFEAELIGGDLRTDTAVIRIDAEGLVPAMLGVSAELEVGEDVIAIGHALGLRGGPTVSKGVVSALGRSIATGPQTTIVDLIQTDASINPGNSGGPLVNDRAEVVGIHTAIIKESQGIGFAINIDGAKMVAEQLVAKGYVERGFIGITPFDLTPALISQTNLGLPIDIVEGVIVLDVGPGFPAEQAGIQIGDVIVEMAGQPVVNTGQLSIFLMSHLPGEDVEVGFYRGKDKMTLTVTLAERPAEAR